MEPQNSVMQNTASQTMEPWNMVLHHMGLENMEPQVWSYLVHNDDPLSTESTDSQAMEP